MIFSTGLVNTVFFSNNGFSIYTVTSPKFRQDKCCRNLSDLLFQFDIVNLHINAFRPPS